MKQLSKIVLLFLTATGLQAQDLRIYHIDVDQADATLFVTPTGRTLLVDSGKNGHGQRLKDVMDEAGVTRIDFFVATHYHEDHYGGIDDLVNLGVPVGQSFDRGDKDHLPDSKKNQKTFKDYQQAVGDDAIQLRRGDAIPLDSGITVMCVSSGGVVVGEDPPVTTEDENDASVSLLIAFGGFQYFVGGDIESHTEGKIASRDLVTNVDVYQANHHGSHTSSSVPFIQDLAPSVVIISSGNNAGFQHPRQVTLTNLGALSPAPTVFQTNKFVQTITTASNVPDQFIGDLNGTGADGTILITVGNTGNYTVTYRSESHTFQSELKPLWLFAAGTPPWVEEPQFDGVALTNFGSSSATLDLELFSLGEPGGSPAQSSPQGVNQASLELPPGEQVARLRTDLFESDPGEPAWIELTGDTSAIGTFFQFGAGSLSQLDGGVAFTETSTNFAITRVFDGSGTFRGQDAVTGVSLFNPNEEAVTVSFSYLAGNGGASTQGAQQVFREIPARSMIAETASDLFGTASLSGGIITGEVTKGDGVVAFEVIQLTDQSTVMGLNAATGNSTNRAYSAQLASLPGLFTSVNVVNLADVQRNVTLRAVQEDGSNQGDPVMMVLDPGEQFTGDAGVLFGGAGAGPYPAQGEGFVGSLIVEADGDGVTGDVIFGDSADFAYAASLPLQTQAFTEALFNQVANVSGFFTGLAFFYPGPGEGSSPQGPQLDAEITIQVFLASGEMVGESVLPLAVGKRISQLVEQLVGEIELAGGYVRIISTEEIIGQMLFGVIGPRGIQLFSAVPPTVVR